MSEPRFSGKTALVIGGNSGIGLAAAQRFARDGARVAIIGRNAETLKSARDSIGPDCIAIRADMSSLAEITRAIDDLKTQTPKVDILFANAGAGAMVPFPEVSEELWDSIMNVNLKGMYFGVQKVLPLMGPGGAIILCSSLSALRAWPGSTIYSCSKAAVNALGRGLATELLSQGIRVNVVLPGGIDTPIFDRNMPPEIAAATKQGMAAHTPMGRLGKPEEIANAVAFLASDEAAYMTGTEIIVDGGVIGCSS
jgi:NAD(P)-dependent dehydrogenase (short-subunit alcohol dehydrogenase family)